MYFKILESLQKYWNMLENLVTVHLIYYIYKS